MKLKKKQSQIIGVERRLPDRSVLFDFNSGPTNQGRIQRLLDTFGGRAVRNGNAVLIRSVEGQA